MVTRDKAWYDGDFDVTIDQWYVMAVRSVVETGHDGDFDVTTDT